MCDVVNCSNGPAERAFSPFSVRITFHMVRIQLEKRMELVVKLECWSLNWNYGIPSKGLRLIYIGW